MLKLYNKVGNQFISVFILITLIKKFFNYRKKVLKDNIKFIKKSQNPLVLVLISEIIAKNMIFLEFNYKPI